MRTDGDTGEFGGHLERQFWGTVLDGIICGDSLDAVLGDLFWEKIDIWRTILEDI